MRSLLSFLLVAVSLSACATPSSDGPQFDIEAQLPLDAILKIK